jgi:hypothetical protein
MAEEKKANMDILKLKRSELIEMYIELRLDCNNTKQELIVAKESNTTLRGVIDKLNTENDALNTRLQNAIIEFRKLRAELRAALANSKKKVETPVPSKRKETA